MTEPETSTTTTTEQPGVQTVAVTKSNLPDPPKTATTTSVEAAASDSFAAALTVLVNAGFSAAQVDYFVKAISGL